VEFYHVPRSNRPKKRDVAPSGMVLCHLDLDYHKSVHADPGLKHLGPEQVTELVLDHCQRIGIPVPSYIMSSGGGLCVFWLFDKPAWKGARKRVTQTNLKLVELFRTFGADRDAANKEKQLLRVPGSLNAARTVRVIWIQDGLSWDTQRYAWRELCDAIAPRKRYSDGEIAEFRRRDALRESRSPEEREKARWRYRAMRERENHVHSLRRERTRRGAQTRDIDRGQELLLKDLEAIIQNEFGGRVPHGLRDLFASRACVAMTHLYDADDVLGELQRWASAFIDTDFVANELPRTMADIIARAYEAEAGGLRLYKGELVDPRYRYKKETLRADLKIEPHQDCYLTYLISEREKQRRNTIAQRKKRRTAGVDERPAYLDQRRAYRVRAAQLRAAGLTWSQVGAQLGVSAGAARNAAARLDPETRQIAESQLPTALDGTDPKQAHTSVSVSTPPLGAAMPAGPAQAGPCKSSHWRRGGAGVGARHGRHAGGSAGSKTPDHQKLDTAVRSAVRVSGGDGLPGCGDISGGMVYAGQTGLGSAERKGVSGARPGSAERPVGAPTEKGRERLSDGRKGSPRVSGRADRKTSLNGFENGSEGQLVPWPEIPGAEVVLLRLSSGRRAIAISGEFDASTSEKLAAEGFRRDGKQWLRLGGTCKLSELRRVFRHVNVVQRPKKNTCA
jgi:hypothetical protein